MRSRVRAIKKLDKLLGTANQIPGDFIISNEALCHHKNVNYLSDIIFLLYMQICKSYHWFWEKYRNIRSTMLDSRAWTMTSIWKSRMTFVAKISCGMSFKTLLRAVMNKKPPIMVEAVKGTNVENKTLSRLTRLLRMPSISATVGSSRPIPKKLTASKMEPTGLK